MGKLLIAIGLVLLVLGAVLLYFPNFPLGRLPGDIRIERENLRFYFPITTCLLIGLILMIVQYVIGKIR